MNYTIGAFSREVELSIDTLRYYEKEKLILPKRNEINRRIYDSSDITWINFIKKLKQTGMPIKDIKEYAKLRYLGDQTIEQRMTLLYKQYDVLVEKREEIELYTQFLLNKIDIYKEMLSARDIK
ncbi:TPA: MerR family transcriptional regulator [Listeria monocytogenes]|uniref:MerR family transcriptional regulator n=2 Tax=Listeria monocytogenes TaxID=1639 RepID=A0A2Z5C3F0_LISMN|nr:MerR family transcriptional regulator [Listeria monocytogenes]EAE1680018.1 MerR family transcriptional regulator [Listeria monocytogenes LIS0071]EAF3077120.1 MerR family transcriptional regulator [Listeria monocytogenes serotype 1/2a]EAH4403983.1 MerR family transcriptional regulator [Listeria monocytogenes serotype 1/2b]MCX60066.1 MerR family transcriptional regulator [Listeria monocytogenes serotype 4b]AGR16501.1 MerR family transcriptional regulator [Listeria monocytogenes]